MLNSDAENTVSSMGARTIVTFGVKYSVLNPRGASLIRPPSGAVEKAVHLMAVRDGHSRRVLG